MNGANSILRELLNDQIPVQGINILAFAKYSEVNRCTLQSEWRDDSLIC